MSRIDDLLHELCPAGVPYVDLGEVSSYTRGVTYSKKDEQLDGPIRVLRGNNITLHSNSLNYDDVRTVSSEVRVRADQWLGPGDVLISAASGSKAHVGKVAYVNEELNATVGGFMAVVRSEAQVRSRFLFHLLVGGGFNRYLRETLSSTTINNLNSRILGGYRVPVPPLEVQDEIVRILDTFSALTAELEAELEARRAQYEHYRGQLLRPNQDQNHGVRWLPMKDLGTWYGGGTPSKSKAHYWDQGTIPWVSPKDMGLESIELTSTIDEISEVAVMESSTKLIPPGSVGLVVRSSILDKRLPSAYFPGAVTLNQDLRAISPNQDVLPQYLAHLLRANGTSILRATRKSGGSVASITVPALMKYRVPIPVIQTQKRVVATLSQFDALVNDLKTGLPAEILARRKQYEYYRDRLLSFEEAST